MIDRGGRWIVGLSFLLALAASAFLALAPVVASEGETVRSDGTVETERSSHTLLEREGPGVLLVLAAPVAVAAVALLAGRTARARTVAGAAAALLLAFALVAAASVGLFYLPAGVAMAVAAARQPG